MFEVYPQTDCENLIEKEEKIYICFKDHSIVRDCCKNCPDYVDLVTAGNREYERRQKYGIRYED